MEVKTHVDILAEIAELDPDFDRLLERCCEAVERDVIQQVYD